MTSTLEQQPPSSLALSSSPVTPTVPWPWIKCIRDMTDPMLFSNSQQQQEQQDSNKVRVELPVQILPWLYWSDLRNAKNTSKLKERGITHILSLMGKMTNEKLRIIKNDWKARTSCINTLFVMIKKDTI